MAEMMAESAQPTVPPSDDRILASGDEAGTAPGDRPFRPDVEGLRAVAVLLVVLFHSQVSAVSGGYVGVDVFFVISGFVITGVLLRERASTGRTSILSFYGRRCRRIIPAATLVIIATVGLAYWFLGVAGGIPTATDGRWAALFLANFHFISTGTNYLASQAPPSPLQNFWSLAVEEQFYVIYPTLFLLVAGARVRTLRARLAMGLIAVIIGSFVYSIVDTHGNPVDAFFSPFTRAWELALGALVAVCTPWLLKVPARAAALATWVGLGAILVAATAFSSQTAYPGYLAAIPVLGAGLIIAGGMGVHSGGAESLLRLAPFRWLGRLSYSLYLWHWPILITAAEYAGKTSLSVKDNLGWDLVALVASMLTYVVVENPVRHALSLRRNRRASIGIGIGLIAVTLGAISLLSSIAPGTGIQQGASKSSITLPAENPYVSLREVLRVVAASDRIHRLPSNLSPGVTDVLMHPGGNIGFPPAECKARSSRSSLPSCVFGDPRPRRTIVLYGDSHAGMWFRAMDGIAHRSGWRLVVLFKPGCPASLVPVPELSATSGDWGACDQWHHFAVNRIRQIRPSVLVISQTSGYLRPSGTAYTVAQWKDSVEQLLARASTPATTTIVIGSPAVPQVGGPDCLGRHEQDVQACSGPPQHSFITFNHAERSAVTAAGGRYIDVIPWLCTRVCSSVIGNDEVYLHDDHITLRYTLFLEGVLGKALALPTS